MAGKNGDSKSTLLEFQVESSNENAVNNYPKIISKLTDKMKLINVKSLDSNILLVSYYVHFRNDNQNIKLVNELQKTSGIKNISLFSDEEAF